MNTELIPDNYQPPSSDDPRGPLERSVAALQRMEREVLLTGRLAARHAYYEAPRSNRLSGAARKRLEWMRLMQRQADTTWQRINNQPAAPPPPRVLRGRQGVRRAG